MASENIRVVNRQNQFLNILVKDAKGKVGTKSLLPRASLDIAAGSLTEQVFDLNRRGHVMLTKVAVAAAPTPEKSPAPALTKSKKSWKNEL